jgi:hypothetical protein
MFGCALDRIDEAVPFLITLYGLQILERVGVFVDDLLETELLALQAFLRGSTLLHLQLPERLGVL